MPRDECYNRVNGARFTRLAGSQVAPLMYFRMLLVLFVFAAVCLPREFRSPLGVNYLQISPQSKWQGYRLLPVRGLDSYGTMRRRWGRLKNPPV